MTSTPKRGPSVGYGKPPQQSRFATGKSGNPTGRPKASKQFKSVRRLVRDFLEQEIAVVSNGRRKSLTIVEAVLQRLAKSALEDGNTQAIKLVLHLADEHIPTHQSLAEQMQGRSVFEFTEEEAARFRKESLLERTTEPRCSALKKPEGGPLRDDVHNNVGDGGQENHADLDDDDKAII